MLNESTLYLAKLMGPVTAVIGLAFLLKKGEMLAMIKKVSKDGFAIFAVGIIELTAGIAIVLKSNLWDQLAAILISLLGWGMIMEGSFGLLASKSHLKRMMAQANLGTFSISGLLMMVIGAYLMWEGYLF